MQVKKILQLFLIISIITGCSNNTNLPVSSATHFNSDSTFWVGVEKYDTITELSVSSITGNEIRKKRVMLRLDGEWELYDKSKLKIATYFFDNNKVIKCEFYNSFDSTLKNVIFPFYQNKDSLLIDSTVIL
jgi:hypothetical protein